MVSELRHLLRESVQSPPSDDLSVSDVLAGARRRVRRRRVAVAVAATVGTLLVGTAALVGAPADLLGADDTDPAEQPGALAVADARPAVAGEDYEELLVRQGLGEKGQDTVLGVTPDGQLLVQEVRALGEDEPTLSLLDPESGRSALIPQGQGSSFSVLVAVDAERLVLSGTSLAPSGFAFEVYDRGSQTWSTLQLPVEQFGEEGFVPVQPGGIAAGRLYFALGSFGSPPAELWSVALNDGSDLRDEGSVGAFAVAADGTLVTTRPDDSEVALTELTSGEETDIGGLTYDGCDVLSARTDGTTIALLELCDNDTRDMRLRVVSTTGEPVAMLEGPVLDLGAIAADFVTVHSSADETQGTYALDVAAQEVLFLGPGKADRETLSYAGGDVLTWGMPSGPRSTTTTVVRVPSGAG